MEKLKEKKTEALAEKKKIAWQKQRKKCKLCGATKYRQYMMRHFIERKLEWICSNADRCARRCSSYK